MDGDEAPRGSGLFTQTPNVWLYSPEMGNVAESIERLKTWAERSQNHRFEIRKAARDLNARHRAPKPFCDAVPEWAVPPSLREALGHFSSAAISWGPSLGHEEFVILSPRGIARYNNIVYLPDGVSRGADAPELSTNHLVAFASGGNDECAFCFDVTQKGANGEYPVYYHHQDEPRARLRESGKWEDPADVTPDFPSFAAWLAWVADTLDQGKLPVSSYPGAFHQMPGRRED